MVQLREVEKVCRCSKGHEIVRYKGMIAANNHYPIRMPYGFKDLCPWCYSDWVEANVPEMKEAL